MRWFVWQLQPWLTSRSDKRYREINAIRMMIGIGTPISQSRIERPMCYLRLFNSMNIDASDLIFPGAVTKATAFDRRQAGAERPYQ
jgi:hypothetical protein